MWETHFRLYDHADVIPICPRFPQYQYPPFFFSGVLVMWKTHFRLYDHADVIPICRVGFDVDNYFFVYFTKIWIM